MIIDFVALLFKHFNNLSRVSSGDEPLDDVALGLFGGEAMGVVAYVAGVDRLLYLFVVAEVVSVNEQLPSLANCSVLTFKPQRPEYVLLQGGEEVFVRMDHWWKFGCRRRGRLFPLPWIDLYDVF